MTCATSHPVCVACTTRAVNWDELVCQECWPSVQAMGLSKPQAQPSKESEQARIQIGPLDI